MLLHSHNGTQGKPSPFQEQHVQAPCGHLTHATACDTGGDDGLEGPSHDLLFVFPKSLLNGRGDLQHKRTRVELKEIKKRRANMSQEVTDSEELQEIEKRRANKSQQVTDSERRFSVACLPFAASTSETDTMVRSCSWELSLWKGWAQMRLWGDPGYESPPLHPTQCSRIKHTDSPGYSGAE